MKLDWITSIKEFLTLESNKDKSDFLYAAVNINDGNSIKNRYFSDFEDLSFLIRNILQISNEESIEIVKQSIPERNPILYKEKILKIF